MQMVASAVLGSVASHVIGSILGDHSSSPTLQAPQVTPPTPMPTADAQAVQQAKQRSLVSQLADRGRASTILTGQTANPQNTSDKLGG